MLSTMCWRDSFFHYDSPPEMPLLYNSTLFLRERERERERRKRKKEISEAKLVKVTDKRLAATGLESKTNSLK